MISTTFHKAIVFGVLFFFISTGTFFLPDRYYSVHAFSVGEEKEIGEKLLSVIRREFTILDDPDISQYINKLGTEILQVTGPQYFDFHFFVINNKTFNAFAAPSGLIFFHTGLIETMANENELISVLAHEIGHVQSRHIAERIEKSSKVSIATLALVLAGIAVGNGALAEALITGGLAAGASMNLSFSRKDEEESDRLAYKWLKESNRDPEAMVGMLRKMYRVSRLHRDMVPPYLLTHPDPSQRLNYVQDMLDTDQGYTFKKADDFSFQRIKYRILAESKDPILLLTRYRKETARVKKEDRDSIMPYYGLSLAYAANADFKNAAKSLKKVISFYPGQPILLTDLGVIYFGEGRYKKALKLFQKAREADPDDAYTAYYLALSYEQLGDEAKALLYYKELLPVLPTYSRIRYNIGQILAAQGKTGEGHYYLGVYHWQEGDSKTATYHLKKAIHSLKPGNNLRIQAENLLKTIKRLEKV